MFGTHADEPFLLTYVTIICDSYTEGLSTLERLISKASLYQPLQVRRRGQVATIQKRPLTTFRSGILQ
jgi:hypothetical protein